MEAIQCFFHEKLHYGYCSGVWACCGEVNSGNLERLQNRAARTVARTPNSSSALSYLKWQSLNSRRDNNIFKLVKKSLNGQCPQYFINYFSFNKDVILRTTRQSNLLHLPLVRTETAKRAFYYHGRGENFETFDFEVNFMNVIRHVS